MQERVFQIYKRLLEIHIKTKSTDQNGFHSDTAAAYEEAFKAFHDVLEKKQDLELESPYYISEVNQEAYDLVEELMGIVYDMIKNNKDYAMDELLRGLALSVSGVYGNMRKHLMCKDGPEKKEEEESEPEEEPMEKPKLGLGGKGLKSK